VAVRRSGRRQRADARDGVCQGIAAGSILVRARSPRRRSPRLRRLPAQLAIPPRTYQVADAGDGRAPTSRVRSAGPGTKSVELVAELLRRPRSAGRRSGRHSSSEDGDRKCSRSRHRSISGAAGHRRRRLGQDTRRRRRTNGMTAGQGDAVGLRPYARAVGCERADLLAGAVECGRESRRRRAAVQRQDRRPRTGRRRKARRGSTTAGICRARCIGTELDSSTKRRRKATRFRVTRFLPDFVAASQLTHKASWVRLCPDQGTMKACTRRRIRAA